MEDDLLFIEHVDATRALCISPLAQETLLEAGVHGLGSDRGYFIYEVCDKPLASGICVLAKVASFEAALRFIDLWRGRAATKQVAGVIG